MAPSSAGGLEAGVVLEPACGAEAEVTPRSAGGLEAEVVVLEPAWGAEAETAGGAAGEAGDAEAVAASAPSQPEAARRACPLRRAGPARQSRERSAAGAGRSGAMAVAGRSGDLTRGRAWAPRPAARTVSATEPARPWSLAAVAIRQADPRGGSSATHTPRRWGRSGRDVDTCDTPPKTKVPQISPSVSRLAHL